MFDTEGTGKVSYETFEKEILVKIGEPMDEKEVAITCCFFWHEHVVPDTSFLLQVADTLRNLNESGAVEGNEIQYEVFVTWIMDQLNK